MLYLCILKSNTVLSIPAAPRLCLAHCLNVRERWLFFTKGLKNNYVSR